MSNPDSKNLPGGTIIGFTDLNAAHIIELLSREYGQPHWQPDGNPVGTLVKTILSQHTSDINSDRTYQSLVAAFSDWESVADADVNEIARSVRAGGLAEIKARRIKQALGEIRRRQGKIELDFLAGLLLDEAQEWLVNLPGVGEKTAACVLLFSLGRPALPVDTHVFRVSWRLGMIPQRVSLGQAHRILGKLVPARDVYPFHMLMIAHGRRVCHARHPRREECVLRKICPSYGKWD